MNLIENPGERAAREQAYRLADSGRFGGWRAVREAMIGAGWPNAGSALSEEYVRLAVDERCAAAKATA